MDYEKLARDLTNNIGAHIQDETLTISMQEAVAYLNTLMAMHRIKSIAESDKGGAEFFT